MVVCILACAEVAAALGIICLADEPGCQGAADTLVKDVLDLGSKDAIDAGSKDSIDALVKGEGGNVVKGVTDDLAPNIRNTFAGGDAQRVVLDEDLNLYQYGNGNPSWSSNFATPTRYFSPQDARAALNLYEWNSANFVRSVTIPGGSTVWVGPVEGGSGIQFFLEDKSLFIVDQWIRVAPALPG